MHFPRCEAKKGFQNPASGVYYGEAPPVPIPNTEVKLTRADNTRRAASREDRSMLLQKKGRFSYESRLFYCKKQICSIKNAALEKNFAKKVIKKLKNCTLV